jgi:radical SAM/Cys-rich protein
MTSLLSRRLPLASPDVQHGALGRLPLACEFDEAVARAGQWPLSSARIEVLQINIGKLCNQTCRHCHVDAGPDRREVMTRETMTLCLEALEKTTIPTVDITGGAPELNPDFRWLVTGCRARGRHVIDRCNLTVLELASQQDLAAFLANHQVEVVCSLPHYRAPNTDRQRGAAYTRSRLRP